MKISTLVVFGALALSACSTVTDGPGYDPIPGSITYTGQPRTKLTKSPIGSTFAHEFPANGGQYVETYQIQPDRSLKIVRRIFQPDILNFND
ncbi:hypothetical protein J2858_000001 [Neorhizobium galegae]|uniref:hypothetical protein n=1 Tax=Neorhizobium galegae TaxID=399 RepID=UPI001AE5C3A2|nr:hypothetical protein [Neorhizobium galegae]MBP2547108.1 hypothetical protein [Neorhizobium galegae]